MAKYVKGQSGNPSGRPPIPEIFKKNLPEAMKAVVALLKCDDDALRLKAAETIISRVLGKPHQSVDMEVGGNFEIVVNVIEKAVEN